MDGLSVAASVAGIVSLGIQVTQSLVQYYSAYRDQDREITHIIKKLQTLADDLQLLADPGPGHGRRFRAEDHGLVEQFEERLRDCGAGLSELKEDLEKIVRHASVENKSSNSGFHTKALTTARRLAYPFRQSTLNKLDEDISEISEQAQRALQIL